LGGREEREDMVVVVVVCEVITVVDEGESESNEGVRQSHSGGSWVVGRRAGGLSRARC